jgi:hypothetical protein
MAEVFVKGLYSYTRFQFSPQHKCCPKNALTYETCIFVTMLQCSWVYILNWLFTPEIGKLFGLLSSMLSYLLKIRHFVAVVIYHKIFRYLQNRQMVGIYTHFGQVTVMSDNNLSTGQDHNFGALNGKS